jgi:hypothetical protein
LAILNRPVAAELIAPCANTWRRWKPAPRICWALVRGHSCDFGDVPGEQSGESVSSWEVPTTCRLAPAETDPSTATRGACRSRPVRRSQEFLTQRQRRRILGVSAADLDVLRMLFPFTQLAMQLVTPEAGRG